MQLAFNATTVDPTQGPEVWPLADYPLEITKEETAVVKDDPNSSMLVLTLTCLDGPMKGKTHPYRLNLWNQNQEAQRIAYQQLSALCYAIERLQIADTAHLVGGRFIGVVGPQKSNAMYSEVKRVKDIRGNEPGKSTPGRASAAPAPSYAQPGAAPTAAAPAVPQGGWQAAPTAAAATGWGTPAAPPPPPPPPAQQAPQLSPDGNWQLVNNAWIAYTAPAAPPPPPAAATGWQPPAGQATQPAAPAPAPAATGWSPNADPNAQPAAAPWGQPRS